MKHSRKRRPSVSLSPRRRGTQADTHGRERQPLPASTTALLALRVTLSSVYNDDAAGTLGLSLAGVTDSTLSKTLAEKTVRTLQNLQSFFWY